MAGALTIGVTGSDARLPWAWWATRWHLLRQGVDPRRLTPAGERDLRGCAGFVIGGGSDIDPAIYGGDVSRSPSVDPERDRFELFVLDHALREGLPVLGICRGAQLLNVHAGGSLFGDLRDLRVHTSNRGTLLRRNIVNVLADSRLADLLETDRLRVNSLHHQAVDRCGEGLAIVARDRDGIAQAIEADSEVLRVGVQWHPEYLPQARAQRSLFRGFARACVRGSRRTES